MFKFVKFYPPIKIFMITLLVPFILKEVRILKVALWKKIYRH